MRVELVQTFRRSPDEVAEALRNPALYDELGAAPKIETPRVERHETDGARTTLVVRYRFAGDISGAARAILDPAKLSWIQTTVFDHDARTGQMTMTPDHYADRLRCSASFRIVEVPSGAERRATLDVHVKAPLVGRAVEAAIASGLAEYLSDEVALIEDFITEHR